MAHSADINVAIAEAINHISRFVIPLYVEYGGKPSLIGSGFFVELNEKLALVSAAHVLNQISATNPLFVYRRPDEVVQVTGKRYLSNSGGIDLGFVLTEGLSLPWEDVDRFACIEEYLFPHRTPRATRRYVIAGYPETKNRPNAGKQTIEAVIHAYHARSIDDRDYEPIGLDPKHVIALPLDRKRAFDLSGAKINFPKPNGMSGSPIWELFTDPLSADEPRIFPLVGVGTTYKNKVMYGTDIGHLLSKLQNAA